MRTRTAFSFVVIVSLAATLGAGLARAQEATDDGAAPAAEPEKAAWEYPRQIAAGGVRLAVEEPMVLSYGLDDGATTLRAAVQVTDAVGRITWGGVDLAGTAHLDLGSRLVLVDGLSLSKASFPELDPELAARATEKLPEELPAELLLRLELFTDRPGAAPADEAPTGRVSTRPPEIHVRRRPAVLVQTDGEPVLEQVGSFPLEYVINTAADVFHDTSGDRWLMLIDGHWATAPKLEGPWAWLEEKLPIVLTQLDIDHPRGHVRRFVPGTKRYSKRVGDTPPERPARIPDVIVTTNTSELVLLEGDPLFTLIPRVKLMTVANTASDLFFHPRTAKYFLLLSGRWFQSDEIDGPWAQHFGDLPDEFRSIPRDHARGHARWSVPGTPECAEAAARAMLRERAFLHRRIQVGVRYEGDGPEAGPVEGMEARKVRNTEDEVFDVGGRLYACVRGAWFTMDPTTRAWTPLTELPAELAAIPESTGAYHINACRPRGPGEKGFHFEIWGPYRGVYLHKGAPMHGNGWDTNGMERNGNWYPLPRTYGDSRWYDPIAGLFRPRSVMYDATLVATASEWDAHTASYGRVRWYPDRYLQGGRRMFDYSAGRDEFDLSAPRPDIYATWAEDVIERDGLPRDRFPLGDRSAEEAPELPPVVADEGGRAYRLVPKGVEMWVKNAWIEPPKLDQEIVLRLQALARVRSVTPDLRRWAAQRAAPLPVNPVVTED